MDFAQLLGAAISGGLIVKAFDFWVVLPRQIEADKQKWLREKRLEAYTELTAQLITFGGDILDSDKTGLEAMNCAAKTVLLIDDPEFQKRAELFFSDVDLIDKKLKEFSEKGASYLETDEGERLFNKIDKATYSLVSELRNSLNIEKNKK